MRLTFFTAKQHFLMILRGTMYVIPLLSQIITNTMKLLIANTMKPAAEEIKFFNSNF